jgi:hypothetical protein
MDDGVHCPITGGRIKSDSQTVHGRAGLARFADLTVRMGGARYTRPVAIPEAFGWGRWSLALPPPARAQAQARANQAAQRQQTSRLRNRREIGEGDKFAIGIFGGEIEAAGDGAIVDLPGVVVDVREGLAIGQFMGRKVES